LAIISAPTKHQKNAKIIIQKSFYAETNGALVSHPIVFSFGGFVQIKHSHENIYTSQAIVFEFLEIILRPCHAFALFDIEIQVSNLMKLRSML
jgi:hypothetical protein